MTLIAELVTWHWLPLQMFRGYFSVKCQLFSKTENLSCSLYGFPSRPFTISMSLHWVLSKSSRSFLKCLMIRSVQCHDGERWGIYHQRTLSVRWAQGILQQDPWHCFQQKALSVLGKHRGTSPLAPPKTQQTPLLSLQNQNFSRKKGKWNCEEDVHSVYTSNWWKAFSYRKEFKSRKTLVQLHCSFLAEKGYSTVLSSGYSIVFSLCMAQIYLPCGMKK